MLTRTLDGGLDLSQRLPKEGHVAHPACPGPPEPVAGDGLRIVLRELASAGPAAAACDHCATLHAAGDMDMPDSTWTLLAAATDPARGTLENLPSTLESGAQAVAAIPKDIGELPLFAHLAQVIPAADLVYGGGMLVFIILVHAAGVRSVTGHVASRMPIILERPTAWRSDLLMASVVFALLALHLLEIFLWASALVYSHLVPDWRTAGFFAGNTYTTVGYGNFVLPAGWRMLAPIIAMSGLFTFGWSGSVLVDVVRRCNDIREAAVAAKTAHRAGTATPAKTGRNTGR